MIMKSLYSILVSSYKLIILGNEDTEEEGIINKNNMKESTQGVNKNEKALM